MPNGDMINELRAMAAGDDKISQANMNRLILSAVANIYEKQEQILCELEDMRELDSKERTKIQNSQNEIKTDIKTKWEDLQSANHRLEIYHRSLENEFHDYTKGHKEDTEKICTALHEEVELLKNNAFVILGNLIQKHPKLASFLALLIFILLNLWFISDTRKLILVLLGFPPNLVEWLPAITPTP